jgi:hypothetical protein
MTNIYILYSTFFIENMALEKPAWQQHGYFGKGTTWGAAKAVDGFYFDRSAHGGKCTISGDGQTTAEWRVDLGRVVSISHIKIFYRTDNLPSSMCQIFLLRF